MNSEDAKGPKAMVLPCPFCGLTDQDSVSADMNAVPALALHSYPGGYRIECEGCNTNGPWHHSHVEAIAAWNRRAPCSPLPASDL